MTKALLDHYFLSLIYYVCEFNTFCWIDVFHEMSVWCCVMYGRTYARRARDVRRAAEREDRAREEPAASG